MGDALAKPSWKAALAPLPQPGPPNADERLRIKVERRPTLLDAKSRNLRRLIAKRHGKEGLLARLHKKRLRTSLAAFVKEAWPILEPGTPLVWNWHIDVICEALEKVTRGEIDRLLINVPPGHMKSRLVCVFWPAWEWLTDPGQKSIYASYHQTLSNRDSQACRELVQSEWYKALIPKLYGEHWATAWGLKDDNNTIQVYATEMQGVHQATSVGGAGAGFRAHKVVIDDPMNTAEFPTDEKLEGVISWFNIRMSSRLNDMQTGALVVIMQRLHENDLAGYILSTDALHRAAGNKDWKYWKHINLRSEYDPGRPNEFDKRTQKGELLFPAKFPQPVIDEAKHKLGNQYAAQHDQDPMPQSGGIFEMRNLCFWYPASIFPLPIPHKEKNEKNEYTNCKQGPLPKAFHEQSQSWDCAFKDAEDNDYVAGQLWGRFNTDCFLVDQTYGHLSFTKTVEAIKQMTKDYPLAFAKYVEDKANGSAVLDVLKDKIFGLVPVEPEGGKKARAQAVSPFISAQNVWLPHPQLYPWVYALLAELRAFPKAKHDDQVDAMSQALVKMVISNMMMMEGMTRE